MLATQPDDIFCIALLLRQPQLNCFANTLLTVVVLARERIHATIHKPFQTFIVFLLEEDDKTGFHLHLCEQRHLGKALWEAVEHPAVDAAVALVKPCINHTLQDVIRHVLTALLSVINLDPDCWVFLRLSINQVHWRDDNHSEFAGDFVGKRGTARAGRTNNDKTGRATRCVVTEAEVHHLDEFVAGLFDFVAASVIMVDEVVESVIHAVERHLLLGLDAQSVVL